MKPSAFPVLFAGNKVAVTFLDGTELLVFVRALPLRFLIRILEAAEFSNHLVELCSYLPANRMKKFPGPCGHPDIPPPVGLAPVPFGFCDNLDDASTKRLYEAAKELNFQRAADHAREQIAAKKLVAPFHEQAVAQVMPLVERIYQPLMAKIDGLSNSLRSAQSSPAAVANKS